jgi:hypothetical protein
MDVETPRYYIFYTLPFIAAASYSQRSNAKIFYYRLEGNREWEGSRIIEKMRELKCSKPMGFKTTKIELAERDGMKLKVIKSISVPKL